MADPGENATDPDQPPDEPGTTKGIQDHEFDRQSIFGATKVVEVKPLHVMGVERQKWGHTMEVLLSNLCYVVGLGNIWRFPYLVYRYGGGTFLVPYTIFLLTLAIPLMFIESASGQYAGVGPFHIYNSMCPGLRGIGVAAIYVSYINTVQYSFISGLIVRYIIDSLNWDLPWVSCDPTYSADGCLGPCYGREENVTYVIAGGRCQPASELCTDIAGSTSCNDLDGTPMVIQAPAFSYFYDNALGIRHSDGSVADWSHYGTLVPEVLGCVMIAYFMCFLVLRKGVKAAGKVMYFMAVIPLILLTILLIRAATLEGFGSGISFYLKPDFSKMFSFNLWYQAMAQVFFSIGVGFGGIMTVASYSDFHTPCFKIAIVVTLATCFVSIYAGFLIFGILGHIATTTNQPIDKIAGSGIGLSFITLPTAFTLFKGAPFWSFSFFIMLFIVGISTQITDLNTQITALLDEFEWARKRRAWTTTIVIVANMIGAFTMVWQGGIWFNVLLNDYGATAPVMIVVLGNLVALVYFYGFDKMMSNIEEMIGTMGPATRKYLWVIWMIVAPIALAFLIIPSFFIFEGSNYSIPHEPGSFPPAIQGFGVFIAFISLVFIPIGFVYELRMTKKEHPDLTARGDLLKIMFSVRPGFLSQQEREIIERTEFLEAINPTGPEDFVRPANLQEIKRPSHIRASVWQRASQNI